MPLTSAYRPSPFVSVVQSVVVIGVLASFGLRYPSDGAYRRDSSKTPRRRRDRLFVGSRERRRDRAPSPASRRPDRRAASAVPGPPSLSSRPGGRVGAPHRTREMPPRQIRTRDGPSPVAHGGQPRPPEAEWWIKHRARAGGVIDTKRDRSPSSCSRSGARCWRSSRRRRGSQGLGPELMLSLAAFGVLVGWAGAMQRRGALPVHLAGSLIAGLIIPFVMISSLSARPISA